MRIYFPQTRFVVNKLAITLLPESSASVCHDCVQSSASKFYFIINTDKMFQNGRKDINLMVIYCVQALQSKTVYRRIVISKFYDKSYVLQPHVT